MPSTPEELGLDDLQRILNNRDNPKTMDYYYFKLLNLKMYTVCHAGKIIELREDNTELRTALNCGVHIDRHFRSQSKETKIFLQSRYAFTMRIFPTHIFPKSHLIKILNTRRADVNAPNPLAGKTTQRFYGPGNTLSYPVLEAPYVKFTKEMVNYVRSAKGRIKPLEL